MNNIGKSIAFVLAFVFFECVGIESLVERGLEELFKYDSKQMNINEIMVDGLPLVIVLSLDGINEIYIEEYERKGGRYDFPEYFLNALCEKDKFDEALYFIYHKKMTDSPLSINGGKGRCLVTAVDKINLDAFEKFYLVAKSKNNPEKINQEIVQLLDYRIKILQGFLK